MFAVERASTMLVMEMDTNSAHFIVCHGFASLCVLSESL